jgi:hypothetical protein
MNKTKIGSNMSELTTANGDVRVLVSYATPVAAVIRNADTGKFEFFRTDCRWSVTTSRHINKYRASWDTLPERTMPQDFFTKLAA